MLLGQQILLELGAGKAKASYITCWRMPRKDGPCWTGLCRSTHQHTLKPSEAGKGKDEGEGELEIEVGSKRQRGMSPVC